MAMNCHAISQESRAILADVKSIGKRVLERFYEGFSHALSDVHRNWRSLKPSEWKIVFEEVRKVAQELIVDKEDGGEADDGLSLGTFRCYLCKVKRALIYNVPLSIAERATNQELQESKNYVLDILINDNRKIEDKMVEGYKWVKEKQIEKKNQLKQDSEKRTSERNNNKETSQSSTIKTPYTLPNIGDYYDDNESVTRLLHNGIQDILAWLENKNMQQYLQKMLPAAKILKEVHENLAFYIDFQQKKERKEQERKIANNS